jgi:hypothetical protein
LDLLTWAPRSAEVIRLPPTILAPAVWRPRIVRVAEVLSRKATQRSRDRYWSDTVATIERKLESLGLDKAQIERQHAAFYSAVNAEMARLRHTG